MNDTIELMKEYVSNFREIRDLSLEEFKAKDFVIIVGHVEWQLLEGYKEIVVDPLSSFEGIVIKRLDTCKAFDIVSIETYHAIISSTKREFILGASKLKLSVEIL